MSSPPEAEISPCPPRTQNGLTPPLFEICDFPACPDDGGATPGRTLHSSPSRSSYTPAIVRRASTSCLDRELERGTGIEMYHSASSTALNQCGVFSGMISTSPLRICYVAPPLG